MLQTIIIDDSPQAIEYLVSLLHKSEFDIDIRGSATSVDEGIELIAKVTPELVFLDIELGDQTGFELLSKLDKITFKLIFTTGYHQYAIDAFKFNAIHYLLKPVQPDELEEALSRVSLKSYKSDFSADNIKSLLETLKHNQTKKLSLSTEEGIRYIDPADIIYVEADGSYSKVKLTDGSSIMLSRLLKEFELQLSKSDFYRVSKSYLINMQLVSMYRRIDGGTVEMIDGTLISIPRRKKEEFLIRMTEFMP